MLMAVPRSWFSWDFTLVDSGKPVARLDMSTWREKGALTISDKSYRVYKEGFFTSTFVLESDGTVMARARKTSSWTRRMVVTFGGVDYELKPRAMLSRGFRLLAGSTVVGTMTPGGFMSRRMKVELSEELPLLLRVFVVWLTVLLWKRESDTAAAG